MPGPTSATAAMTVLTNLRFALEGELGELRERLARAEAERDAAVRTGEIEARLLRETLAEVRADRDRTAELLRAALDRPSWWERALRAVRGTGEHQPASSG